MSFGQNTSGYCNSCGSSNGCSCNSSGGYDYSTCSPDYNPVTVNSSVCPNLEGGSSSCQGGSASGNNSSVHVSVGGCGCQSDPKKDCCCKDGAKKLLDYLYKKSLDDPIKTNSMCIYGDAIPNNITSNLTCNATEGRPLLTLTNPQIQTLSITDDIVRSVSPQPFIVSICAMSVIKFTFTDGNTVGINNDNELRKEFFYTPKCKCCCDCGDGIAQSLYLNGLGQTVVVTVQDTILVNTDNTLDDILLGCVGCVGGIQPTLVAVDSLIAILSVTLSTGGTIYFGIPTCKIARIQL